MPDFIRAARGGTFAKYFAAAMIAVTVPLQAQTPPGSHFVGTLHAHGPRGVFTEIQFAPHQLLAKVHEPQLCLLHAHLVHGDPHTSRYTIEPAKGGRFCDELVGGEVIIHPRSRTDISAEFRSPRMDWSGEFHVATPKPHSHVTSH